MNRGFAGFFYFGVYQKSVVITIVKKSGNDCEVGDKLQSLYSCGLAGFYIFVIKIIEMV